MIPAIETHDFSDHLVKLDTILTDIVNQTSLVENQKILENFKELMIEDDTKEITVSKLFELWCDYVVENVSTDGLEVIVEDDAYYEDVECIVNVEDIENRSWSDIKQANIIFECKHDERMNFCIPISNWKKYDGDKWGIDYKQEPTINSLRHISKFEVILMKLKRLSCKLIIDITDGCEDVTPKEEPEASY